nr:unnamed protein product [Callosobruchus chinensis]
MRELKSLCGNSTII